MFYIRRLYDLRIDNDLRQCDVARVLSVTKQAYCLYENGKRDLPVEHLVALARYYGVTTDYILGISEIKTPKSPESD